MKRLARWMFRVEGQVIPKGSVNAFVVRNKQTKHPRAVVTQSRQSKVSEQAIKVAARAELDSRADYTAAAGNFYEFPVRLIVRCQFEAPQWVRQRRKANQRRAGYEPLHKTIPDASKLLRTVEDALTGIAYRDDRQVFDERLVKLYAAEGDAHAIVEVEYYPEEYRLDGPVPELLDLK